MKNTIIILMFISILIPSLLPWPASADIAYKEYPTYVYKISNLDQYTEYVFFDNYFFINYKPDKSYLPFAIITNNTAHFNHPDYRQLYAIRQEDYQTMPRNGNKPQEIKAYLDSLSNQGKLIKAINEIENMERNLNDKPNDYIIDVYEVTSFTDNTFALQKIRTEREVKKPTNKQSTSSNPLSNLIFQIGLTKIIFFLAIFIFGITLGTILGIKASKKQK